MNRAKPGTAPSPRRSTAPHLMTPSLSIWPASTCSPDRWTHCAGWPWATGFGGGGPRAERDGIVMLDAALLDAEIAIAHRCRGRLLHRRHLRLGRGGDTGPHAAALNAHVQQGDPRVLELVRKCQTLPTTWASSSRPRWNAAHRDDYALAAGGDTGKSTPAMIAAGVGSVAVVSRAFRHLRCGRGHRQLEHRSRR